MHFVISLAAPGDLELDWVESVYAGEMTKCIGMPPIAPTSLTLTATAL